MTRIVLLIITLAFSALSATAQPGANDPTFNPTDIGFGFGDGANNAVHTTTVQADGKIIIGGAFTSYNGADRNYIARLNADGSLDTTFAPGTGANSSVTTTSIQADGKIIIGGWFTSYNGTDRNYIARLNADGSLDATFDPGTGATNTVSTSSIQADGKIIIGGDFTSYNGTGRSRIARLNADGSLDTSFNPGTGASSTVFTNSIQADGKIIIGGSFGAFNGTGRNRIARLNADGSLDATFDPGTGANTEVWTTAVQADGKIIIGGLFFSYNGTGRNRIARLNADGSLDASFDPGTGASTGVLTTSVQADGKIIIGGHFFIYNGTGRNRIARLNADGSLDATFDPGTGANGAVFSASIQDDGKIIIGGDFGAYNGTGRNRIARLNADGSLDATFSLGTGANEWVYTTAIQADGKIIIGGNFTNYNGTGRNYIARLNADGSLDATFDPGTGANNTVWTISTQADGKIIIGGFFNSFNGTGRNRIARLNADGSLDATFNPGTGANALVVTTAVQTDGKIIIGGSFTTFNGTGRNRIARLNADGSLDAIFNPGTGANSSVSTTSIQTDGKIIIGGYFTSFNGTGRNYIARLNADGSLDAAFNLGTVTSGGVNTTSIQADGKIIIGGLFTSDNGTDWHIARLNEYGSLDASFNPGTGANSDVSTTSIQADGKIIIGGWFTSYNGTDRNRIARLNADGSLDANFDPGTGANNSVYTTSIQADGKIIIGGEFTSYDGTGRNRIARVLAVNDCPLLNAHIDDPCDDGDPCTENDTVDANCDCTGTPLPDSDGDGICDAEDPCPLAVDGIANFDENSCACELGYFATITDIGGNDVITTCTICPAGSFCPDGLVATECPAGRYQDQAGQIACFDCDAGTFNSNTGATSCQACPAGTFNAVSGAVSCTPCAAGFSNANTGQTSCTACPPGSFSGSNGQVECDLCPANTYNTYSAAIECSACPSGEGSEEGATLCSTLYDCPDAEANIGDACDDGDPDTGNDTVGSDCTCSGVPSDCAGAPGGNAYLDHCGACIGGNTGYGSIYSTASVIDADCDLGTFSLQVIVPETGGPLAGVVISWSIDGGQSLFTSEVNQTTVTGIAAGSTIMVTVSNSISGVCEVELGPYSHSCNDCDIPFTADAGADAVVFFGPYSPEPCATLTGSATGGAPFPGGTYLFQWDAGPVVQGTSLSREVCPVVDTQYTLTVTDAEGCITTDQVMVHAVNTQCGGPGNNNKVRICINGNSVCVAAAAVEAVLAGNPNATRGPCRKNLTTAMPGINIFPNPNNGQMFLLSIDEIPDGIDQVGIDLFDMAGKSVFAELHQVHGTSTLLAIHPDTDFAPGMYMEGSAGYCSHMQFQCCTTMRSIWRCSPMITFGSAGR